MRDRRKSLIDQLAMTAPFVEDLEVASGDQELSSGRIISEEIGELIASDQQLVFDGDMTAGACLPGEPDEEEGLLIKKTAGVCIEDRIEDLPQGSEELDTFEDRSSLPGGYSQPPSSSLNNTREGASLKITTVEDKSGALDAGLPPQLGIDPVHPTTPDSRQETLTSVPGSLVRRGSHSPLQSPIRTTLAGSASAIEDKGKENKPSKNGTMIPFLGRMPILNLNRRQHLTSQAERPPAVGDMDVTMDSLATRTSNAAWENVAAASPIVSAGAPSSGNTASRHIKFAVGDAVLVLLTLLNVTNVEDPKDTFTVAPVNRLGFPQGEGGIDEAKVGPYIFVLATVNHVHFDEDDRYYTVVRADTGTEQRADSGWIEPLDDPDGLEAASRAAKLTVRSAQGKPAEDPEETGYLHDARDFFLDIISWPADISRSKLLPWYRRQRANVKLTAMRLLFGDLPFTCRLRITGINLLVACSISFLFLEVANLAFLPATYDKQVAIYGAAVWSVLVLELMFEVIIRPRGYAELVQSDRAFSPSTARHINRFHVIFESLALVSYIPELRCIGNELCQRDSVIFRITSSLDFVIGESHGISARGRFLLGLTALRLFGPIRHWKQMTIKNSFRTLPEGIDSRLMPRGKDDGTSARSSTVKKRPSKKNDDGSELFAEQGDANTTSLTSSEDDQYLKNAATIGTALMVVNTQRALVLLTAIVLVLPLLQSLTAQNTISYKMVDLLQAHNVAAPTNSPDDCSYLETSVYSWLQMAAVPQPASLLPNMEDTYVLWARVLPVRCSFQRKDGVITFCKGQVFDTSLEAAAPGVCEVWDEHQPLSPIDAMASHFAKALNIRSDGIRRVDRERSLGELSTFGTSVIYNENPTISLVNMGDFFVLLGTLFVGLYGLNALRGEAVRLVLDPLQRMLKIVLRYAENPLSQDVNSGSNPKDGSSSLDVDLVVIGNYETEQLINAISKIADLLRKCWGVAGAGIISSNLARTKDGKTVVFNPTVPGKRVYALFGFVAINGFSEQLRALDRDVMILINDVAKVVHDEVYRWALGDHGQCNKNLGAAFLMVFRIGDFSEVHKKKQVATEKLFREYSKTSTKRAASMRNRNTSRSGTGRSPYSGKGSKQDVDVHLQLASLPGIQAFTDRALLGMLKSFAGVHRDKQLTMWKNDFRLSAGVSAYHVDIIYGMDAGWAVEGAVGSEHKIDATYLSPHVNMASRMMSASKQYGVTILLSKAVEELLSRTCRKKLRHIDTVFVKGSNVKQEIFTYDARFQGVDFFLFERTPEQADLDAESYTANIWEHDRDLLAMRQHVSDMFAETFNLGVKQYLAGTWQEAYKTLERADDVMMETVLADGYLEYDAEELEGRILDRRDQSEDIVRVRHRIGDGACRALMTYMERRKCRPPDDWDGVRQLSSK